MRGLGQSTLLGWHDHYCQGGLGGMTITVKVVEMLFAHTLFALQVISYSVVL